ncbi:synaptonemal complex central element protein 2 [Syngnathus acus]|uniref:synaptonemal complex central element protein 2 n=1 Tax=Syngnathus acus TaxID=161584 RepID=UPI0018862237|nr:synaptonemal complex central element protein 2 [Syngnathus acus]
MDYFFGEAPASNSSQNEGRDEDPRMVDDSEASSSRNDTEENSSSYDISRRVQELVDKIHNHRANDHKEIESFQQTIVDKVTEVCQQMKGDLYKAYEENSDEMQVKLMELTNVLDICSKLHRELLEASKVLTGLRDGLAVNGTAESMTD